MGLSAPTRKVWGQRAISRFSTIIWRGSCFSVGTYSLLQKIKFVREEWQKSPPKETRRFDPRPGAVLVNWLS